MNQLETAELEESDSSCIVEVPACQVAHTDNAPLASIIPAVREASKLDTTLHPELRALPAVLRSDLLEELQE